MSPVCLPALVLAASIAIFAVPRLGPRLGRWSATVKAWMLRAAVAVLIGSFAVALALALVGGGSGGAFQRLPALEIGILASIALAALLVWRSRGSPVEPL